MATRRRDADTAPGAWVVGTAESTLQVDFDLDLNPGDDPNAGFVYVQPEAGDTEAAVFDAAPCNGPDPATTE